MRVIGQIPTRLEQLLAELRDLPRGLDTPLRAGCLVTDVLIAEGWPESAVVELIGLWTPPGVR